MLDAGGQRHPSRCSQFTSSVTGSPSWRQGAFRRAVRKWPPGAYPCPLGKGDLVWWPLCPPLQGAPLLTAPSRYQELPRGRRWLSPQGVAPTPKQQLLLTLWLPRKQRTPAASPHQPSFSQRPPGPSSAQGPSGTPASQRPWENRVRGQTSDDPPPPASPKDGSSPQPQAKPLETRAPPARRPILRRPSLGDYIKNEVKCY